MTERKGAEAGAEAVVSLGDGWENDDGAGRRPEDEAGRGVVVAFGQTMKTLRVREGLEREEFGRRIGYSASTVASFEQGGGFHHPGRSNGRMRCWGPGGCCACGRSRWNGLSIRSVSGGWQGWRRSASSC